MGSNHDRPFRTLAVIGAGNMGSGIAQKMATEGFPVILVDVDEEQVARGLGILDRTLAQGVERKIFKPPQAEEIRARVRGTADWSELADVDLVVEAVFEDRAVKKQVFERLDEVCRPDAALATNTSSLSVTELASATRRPERVLGLHYFYHPAKNRLVEVIPGERTDPSLLRRSWALQEQIGKTPIASADRAGFVVNRFFVPWLNEAVRCLEEGRADLATIEEAAKRAFGVGMGPFELMNVTGIPIALHAATTLGQAFGPLYAPAAALARQVESGASWDRGTASSQVRGGGRSPSCRGLPRRRRARRRRGRNDRGHGHRRAGRCAGRAARSR
jgi:enoyl-CoA hydratase/3-hydroxyacyl-CoA dehydrogenase